MRSSLRSLSTTGLLLLLSACARPVSVPLAPPDPFDGAAPGDRRAAAGIDLAWVPAGEYTIGSPRAEPERRPGEDQVRVTITRGYWIARFEVTQAQWRREFAALPAPATAGEGDALPVYSMNWAEAEDFCRRLTDRARAAGDLPAGWEFRLPTEAQWEIACRAGTSTPMHFGTALGPHQANFQGRSYDAAAGGSVPRESVGGSPTANFPPPGRMVPVGSYDPNAWGLYDMHGNAYEWCRDWYHIRMPGGADPDLRDAVSSATPSENGDFSRVRRGGCWADDAWALRSAFRLRFEPDRRADHIGFRVVAVRL